MIIIKSHNTKSRNVHHKDINRIKNDSTEMLKLLLNPRWEIQPNNRTKKGLSIVHCQITNKDPLRFFVLRDGTVILNPCIHKHTKTTIDSLEGCLSFPENGGIIVQRWNKIQVTFDIIYKDILIPQRDNLNGQTARIFQHEIDHMDGKNIYEN